MGITANMGQGLLLAKQTDVLCAHFVKRKRVRPAPFVHLLEPAVDPRNEVEREFLALLIPEAKAKTHLLLLWRTRRVPASRQLR